MTDIPYRSECNCPCHYAPMMHMFPCCHPDPVDQAEIPTFTCAVCGDTYDKARPDNEAMVESEAKFQMPVSEETHVVVCDGCFKRMFEN